jgi:hypothetical protein
MNEYKKIQQIKNNIKMGDSNIMLSHCVLGGEYISGGNAISLNVKNNHTTYASNDYLSDNIFNDLGKISNKFKIDILTLAYLGAIITNKHNEWVLQSYNNIYTLNDCKTYVITFKNGLVVNIFDNDAKSKKYFNILKKYKKSIKTIEFATHISVAMYDDEHCHCEYSILVNIKTFLIYYPPYIKKLFEFRMGVGYNPDSKKTTIKFW